MEEGPAVAEPGDRVRSDRRDVLSHGWLAREPLAVGGCALVRSLPCVSPRYGLAWQGLASLPLPEAASRCAWSGPPRRLGSAATDYRGVKRKLRVSVDA
jgi:hypothetical protein